MDPRVYKRRGTSQRFKYIRTYDSVGVSGNSVDEDAMCEDGKAQCHVSRTR